MEDRKHKWKAELEVLKAKAARLEVDTQANYERSLEEVKAAFDRVTG